jgi:methionyl-tRNA synthetase
VASKYSGHWEGYCPVCPNLSRISSIPDEGNPSFHALYLPAMLLAMGKPLSHTLLAHAHWTAQQRKMSKSIGNVADPFDAMELWGVDAVRFYMARVGGRFKDDVGMATHFFPRIFMNEPLYFIFWFIRLVS